MDPFSLWLSLAVLAIASVHDLRTREVPDFLSYGYIALALGVHVIASLVQWSIAPLLESLAGLAVAFCIGWLMFRLGQWGGGDSKLLMGLGAAVGIPLSLDAPFIIILPIPFIASFLLNMVLVGALYALLASLILAARKRKEVAEAARALSGRTKAWRNVISVACLIAAILVAVLFVQPQRLMLAALLLLCAAFPYLWVWVKAVEEGAMKKWILPSKVTEGDWIATPIVVGKKTIAGPKDPGITREQMAALMAAYKKGKVRKVQIKEGIPFVPTFLFAFIVTMLLGDVIRYVLL